MRSKIILITVPTMLLILTTLYFVVHARGRSIFVEGILTSSSISQTYNKLYPDAGFIDNLEQSLTGAETCTDGVKEGKLLRPIGVMLAADVSTRPLSGIAQADVVFEMPVVVGGINRFLAIFQCTNGGDIGSIRSARDDFIPLVASFDAIYAHWGGSHFAQDQLRKKIIDNIDALRNPYGAYYRKKGIRSPDNGFSSIERLRSSANKLGYRMTQKEGYGYKRIDDNEIVAPAEKYRLDIKYPGRHAVSWAFDPTRKTFSRTRGNTVEIDKNINKQVETTNIIIIKTLVRPLEGQYNDVKVSGRGEAIIYRAGEEIKATWEKDENYPASRLRFIDEQGNEILLAKGKIWIEYIGQTTITTYTPIP